MTTTPTKKKTTLKLQGALGSLAGGACTGFEHTDAKFPITAGMFKMSIQVGPGGTCDSLVTGEPLKTKLKIKWEGVNPKTGKLATVAKDTTTLASVSEHHGPRGFTMLSVSLTDPKSKFLGKSATFDIVIDERADEIAQACATPKKGLQSLHFGGANGPSKLTLS